MASPFSCASFSTFKPTIESEGRPLYYYFSVNDLSTGAMLVKNSKYTRSRKHESMGGVCVCVCGGGGGDHLQTPNTQMRLQSAAFHQGLHCLS